MGVVAQLTVAEVDQSVLHVEQGLAEKLRHFAAAGLQAGERQVGDGVQVLRQLLPRAHSTALFSGGSLFGEPPS